MLAFDSFTLVAASDSLDVTAAAADTADAVEFRMDLAERPLDELAGYEGTLPVLATNRAAWEGGEASDDEERLNALAAAAEHAAVEAVDVELASLTDGDGERVVDTAHKNDAAVVVSAHDFAGTPPRDAMRETLESAANRGDVGKLAVSAATRRDVLDLLSVTLERDEAGDAVATMAMGEAGRHSRAVAPLYGSKIGYAPVDPADATAPGQYDLDTLAALVERLR